MDWFWTPSKAPKDQTIVQKKSEIKIELQSTTEREAPQSSSPTALQPSSEKSIPQASQKIGQESFKDFPGTTILQLLVLDYTYLNSGIKAG